MRRNTAAFAAAEAAQMKKLEEEKLVRKLLSGDLMHRGDDAADERTKFMHAGAQEQLPMHHTSSKAALGKDAPIHPSKVLGKAAMDRPTAGALQNAVEIEKARRKVIDGLVLAMDTKKKFKPREGRSEEDRDKQDEQFYFAYEKLHELKTELDVARREISHEKYGPNSSAINALLTQPMVTQKEEIELGDGETYEHIEKMMKALVIRRSSDEESLGDTDSPAYLHLIKHKLNDAREQIDDLRKKVRELTSALKVASVESKSAQSLLVERNEDVSKMRSTINVLQMQLKNYKNRGNVGASGGGGTAGQPASKDDLLRDLDQLRQEYQDLADVNLMLERELKMMRIRNAFSTKKGEKGPEGSPLSPRHAVGLARQTAGVNTSLATVAMSASTQSRGGRGAAPAMDESFDDIPTTKLLMGMLDAKRKFQLRTEQMEMCAMAAHDVNAGRDPFEARRQAKLNNMVAQNDGIAQPVTLSSLNPVAARPKPAPSPTVDANDGSGMTPPKEVLAKSNDEKPAEEEPQPAEVALKAVSDAADAARTAPSIGRGWIVLRQKLISTVALSRADVLRREETHVKKLRHRIALLSDELTTATGERDALGDRVSRVESELAEAKEAAAAAHARAERLQAANKSYQDSLPSTANGGRRTATSQEGSRWAGREDEQVAAIRGELKGQQTDDGSLNEDVDKQIENIVDIFTSKIKRLETDVSNREARIRELAKENEDAVNAMAAAAARGGFETPEMTPRDLTLDKLETQVNRKDLELMQKDKNLRGMEIKLLAAEDELTEARAVERLGISQKCAARVVPRLRDWAYNARLAVRNENSAQEDETKSNVSATSPSSRMRSVQLGETSLRRTTGAAVVEANDEEEEMQLLNQMLNLSTNPTVQDHIAQVINAMELDDVNAWEGSNVPTGDALSRTDKQWAMMRRLWLRLLTVREQAWQSSTNPEVRKKLENKVIETYADFLKFEQLDQNQSRPSFCAEGAMRALSFASAPITKDIVQEEEVHREYTALKELVKTRAAQQLQLEAQRDEYAAQLERLSNAHKRRVAPQSALYILHTVDRNETAASIAVTYGLTNMLLIRQTFAHAPRQNEAIDDDDDGDVMKRKKSMIAPKVKHGMYVPLQSLTALNAATDTEGVHLVVRHLVGPHDTVNAIATQYSVTAKDVCRCGTLEPLLAGEFVGVVDVIVPRRVAFFLVQSPQPENPMVQTQVSVFAVLPRAVPPFVASRTFNVAQEDVELYNEPLKEDVTVKIPLVFSKALVSILPDLVDEGLICVQHEKEPGETLESVAEKYGVPASSLHTEDKIQGSAATMVPLTDFVALADYVYDDATSKAIEQMARNGNKTPLKAPDMDTPLIKLMLPQVEGAVDDAAAESDGILSRVGSIRGRRSSTIDGAESGESGQKHWGATELKLIDHHVGSSERLESIARKYQTLREDMRVPNFGLLDGTTATWAVRLHSGANIQQARELGAEVHAICTVYNKNIASVAESLGIPVETLKAENPELSLESEATISGRLRIPVLNNKVQDAAMQLTGEFFATVSAMNTTVDAVAKSFDVQPADVIAFDVVLAPGVTPVAKISVVDSLPTEHRLIFSFAIDKFTLQRLAPDDHTKLRHRLERDIYDMCVYAKTAQTTGELESVHVVHILDSNVVTVSIIATSSSMLDAIHKLLQDDGPLENLEDTADFLRSAGFPEIQKVCIAMLTVHQHHFAAAWRECHVVAVRPDDTLASIAMRTSVGVRDLIAFNDGFASTAYLPAAADATPESLEGVADVKIPSSRDQRMMVRKNDSLLSIAQRVQCDITVLKQYNVEKLPLLLMTESLRVPKRRAEMITEGSITIRTHGANAESLLALCTRLDVALDDVMVNTFQISVGTVLQIQPTVGAVYRNGQFFVCHGARQHRCENGETLEGIAEQYNVLVDEIKYSNASRLRIPPRTCVGLSSHSTGRRSGGYSGNGTSSAASAHDGARSTIIRHVVLEGETLPGIALMYTQPITSVLQLNPQLYDVPNVHRIFVPVAQQESDDVLTSQASNIYTIVQPGTYDTIPSLSRKFMVAQDRVAEANVLLDDPQHIILPIMSPMAASIARSKRLQLFVGIELHRNETLMSVADRYGVAVKDMMVLGKPLKPMNIKMVDVPISHDTARKILAMPDAGAERGAIFYRTQAMPTESTQSVAKDFNLPTNMDALLVAPGLIEVPITTEEALQCARKRDAQLTQQRNSLAQKHMGINQALRQLVERNEATKRELAKVEALREAKGEGYLSGPSKYNTETAACQTDETEFEVAAEVDAGATPASPTSPTAPTGGGAQPPRARRNGASQTKLLSSQLAQLEDAASTSSTKLRFLEVKADDAVREKGVAQRRIEELEHDMAELRVTIAQQSEDLSKKADEIQQFERQRRTRQAAAATAASMPKILPASAATRKKETPPPEQKTKTPTPPPGDESQAGSSCVEVFDAEAQYSRMSLHSALTGMTPPPQTVDAEMQTMPVLTEIAAATKRPKIAASPGAASSLAPSPASTPLVKHSPIDKKDTPPAVDVEAINAQHDATLAQVVAQYDEYIDREKARMQQLFGASMQGVKSEVSDMKNDVRRIMGGICDDVGDALRDIVHKIKSMPPPPPAAAASPPPTNPIANRIAASGSVVVSRPAAVPERTSVGKPRATRAKSLPLPSLMSHVMQDARPDDDLDDREWVTKQLTNTIVDNLAASKRAESADGQADDTRDGADTGDDTDTGGDEWGKTPTPPYQRTPPQENTGGTGQVTTLPPILRTAREATPPDVPPMRPNVVRQTLGDTQHRPATVGSDSSSTAADLSDKPEPIQELMRLSHSHKRPPRKPRDGKKPAELARVPTPPDQGRNEAPERPGRHQQPQKARPARAYERPEPPVDAPRPAASGTRPAPKQPDETKYDSLQADVARLVSYAAEQNKKMTEWAEESMSMSESGQGSTSARPSPAPVPPPQAGVPPVMDDLAPLVTVMEKLQTGDMTDEQAQVVDHVRELERNRKREAVALRYRTMRVQLELKSMKDLITDTADPVKREKLMKIAAMWNGWLRKWNKRRRALDKQHRSNLQLLISAFVVTHKEFEELVDDSSQHRVSHGSGSLPPGAVRSRKVSHRAFGASRPDLASTVLVVRPHRPGSKWQPLQPPPAGSQSDAHAHTDPSSKHFRVTF